MRYLTGSAIALALIAGSAPAMAQAGPSAYEPPVAVQVPSSAEADGHWQLLQGYGKDGEVTFTWYRITAPNLSRYHGS